MPPVAVGHLVPQPLQLFGSVCSLTHVPLQSVYPPLQAVPHVLLTHVGWEFAPPAGHALPHPLQLAGLSVVLTHVVPLQSVGAEPEQPLTHVVPLHTGTPAPALQTVPHAPQLGDTVMFVSHPSSGLPVQCAQPGAQSAFVKLHTPPAPHVTPPFTCGRFVQS